MVRKMVAGTPSDFKNGPGPREVALVAVVESQDDQIAVEVVHPTSVSRLPPEVWSIWNCFFSHWR